MTSQEKLSDKALAVFAFAAFHQLESGDAITSVIAQDAAGHRADPQAVEELSARDLGELKGDRFHFTAAGQRLLSQVVDHIRSINL